MDKIVINNIDFGIDWDGQTDNIDSVTFTTASQRDLYQDI